MSIQGPQQANAQSDSGGHSQTCTQEATAPSSSGGVDVACVQEAGQCEVS